MVEVVVDMDGKAIYIWSQSMARDRATYSCPWAKIGIESSTPMTRKDWPWDLLIDMPKAIRIGNWRLRRLKGRAEEVSVVSTNRGINAGSPAWVPVRILASMTLVFNAVIINLIPLQRPAEGSRLHSSMIGHPTLRVMECTGIPETLTVLRYSWGKDRWSLPPLSSRAVSTLR